MAGVHRVTWTAWEQDEATPAYSNYRGLEDVLHWAPGSVDAIYKGGEPSMLRCRPVSVCRSRPAMPRWCRRYAA